MLGIEREESVVETYKTWHRLSYIWSNRSSSNKPKFQPRSEKMPQGVPVVRLELRLGIVRREEAVEDLPRLLDRRESTTDWRRMRFL